MTTETYTAKTAMSAAPGQTAQTGGRVTVRHYCQGIGDCHLLRFPKENGEPFWMLIDCGVHSSVVEGKAKMAAIVGDIAAQTSHLDVVVATHEHVDHLSGFFSEQARFQKDISVGEVWLAWTENPDDPQARELDRYKEQALAALQGSSARLARTSGLSQDLAGLRSHIDAVLEFSIGLTGERVRAQRNAAAALAQGRVRYCEPSQAPITPDGLPGLRIYVLGPPRDAKLLGITDRPQEMYSMAAGGYGPLLGGLAGAFAAADPRASNDRDDETAPFDANVGNDFGQLAASGATATPAGIGLDIVVFAHDYYFGPATAPDKVITSRPRKKAPMSVKADQSWRRIDHDWLSSSAELAMQLDSRTNNTSLVLAFEFTDTGRVLLFAADAQVGNWLSWQNASWGVGEATVTGPDLLARTVYYKVGHHGSENATLKAKGLERMTSPDLAAFIPVNEEDARKLRWNRMPLPALVEALGTRCGKRVIRADDDWLGQAPESPHFAVPSGSIKKIAHQTGLWVELELA
uniref:Metallo-beta-lactamase domain-containing protein n=1 Tax=Desulfovibrio sp. U5L TaxID=596152 RepID=I2PZD8_9BACT